MSKNKAEKLTLNIPGKLYVGVQQKKEFNKEDPPLAFAIAYDAKTFNDQKKTVDNWAGYNRVLYEYERDENNVPLRDQDGRYIQKVIKPETEEQGFVIDNDLVDGFYFDRHVSRWRTNNKFFRITDPRGFQLEIDCENLGDILLNCAISQGYLVGKFQWCRYNGKAYLVREDHPARVRQIAPKIAKRPLKAGDLIKFSQEEQKYVYLGKYFVLGFGERNRFRHISGMMHNNIPHRYWGSTISGTDYDVNNYTTVTEPFFKKDVRGVHVFFPVADETDKKKWRMHNRDYKLMRSQGTYELLDEGYDTKEFEDGEQISAWNTATDLYCTKAYMIYKDKKSLAEVNVSSLNLLDRLDVIRDKETENTRKYNPNYNRVIYPYTDLVELND